MSKRVGFTGTRHMWYVREKRALALINLLRETEPSELHYGDCVGADHIAFLAAKNLGIWTVSHPPEDPKFRSFSPADEIREPLPYLIRNHNIVDETDLLITLPKDPEEEEWRGSGTWATIRYAKSQGKKVIFV